MADSIFQTDRWDGMRSILCHRVYLWHYTSVTEILLSLSTESILWQSTLVGHEQFMCKLKEMLGNGSMSVENMNYLYWMARKRNKKLSKYLSEKILIIT